MIDEKALTVVQDAAPDVWGEREEVAGIARRLRAMLPNGNKLSEAQVFSLAQYARLTGLDVFTGAVHAMPDGGLIDNYKVLTAWAQSKELFTEKAFPLTPEERAQEGLGGDDVIEAWKVYLLKKSAQQILPLYLQSGLPLTEALDLLCPKGIGSVRKSDITGRDGKPYAPPKTKTWAWVAQKRALRAAIAIGYGQPTLAELAALGERARAEGWADVPVEALARAAQLSDQARQIGEANATLSAEEHRQKLARNTEILRGPANEPLIGEEPELPPEELFYQRVAREIPYFKHVRHVSNTARKLGLAYDPAGEDALLDALDAYARQRADEQADGGPVQETLI